MKIRLPGLIWGSLAALSSCCIIAQSQPLAAAEIAIPLEAPAPFRHTPEAFNAEGVAKANQGDLRGAIAAFSQAIQLNANFDAAYNNRGFARFKLGDAQGAFADLNRAIEINPNDPLAYYNRAIIRYQLKAFRSAIADLTASLQLKADNPLSYYSRAIAHLRLKNYKNAASDLQKAAELHRQQGNQQGYEQAQALIKKLEVGIN